jgi:pimeloyl-ACP methyl ester carboxylesterase
MFGHKGVWRRYHRFFTENGFETIMPTLKGHVGSSYEVSTVDGLTIEDYHDQLQTELRAIDRPVILVGHSLGALLVQLLENSMFEMVRGMVIMNSVAPWGTSWSLGLTWASFLRCAITRPEYRSALITGKGFHFRREDARAIMMNDCGMAIDNDPEEFFPSQESGMTLRQMAFGRTRVKQALCPTLVVGSRKDRVAPFRVQSAINKKHDSERCPSTMLEIDGGHLAAFGNGFDQVSSAILSWYETDIRGNRERAEMLV